VAAYVRYGAHAAAFFFLPHVVHCGEFVEFRTISGSKYGFDSPIAIAIAVANGHVWIANANGPSRGSVTELRSETREHRNRCAADGVSVV
jgi:hypothetical protein